MELVQIFDSASSVMTVVSFLTFIGIALWAYAPKRGADFAQAAALPFADDEEALHG
jgi:cytochrome c oxidase cbb3-type subunit 4